MGHPHPHTHTLLDTLEDTPRIPYMTPSRTPSRIPWKDPRGHSSGQYVATLWRTPMRKIGEKRKNAVLKRHLKMLLFQVKAFLLLPSLGLISLQKFTKTEIIFTKVWRKMQNLLFLPHFLLL
jgi:hypothetical protein